MLSQHVNKHCITNNIFIITITYHIYEEYLHYTPETNHSVLKIFGTCNFISHEKRF
jgi:hypothetical protein